VTIPQNNFVFRTYEIRRDYPDNGQLEKLSFKYLNLDEDYTPDWDDPTKIMPFQSSTDRIANIFLGLDNLAGEVRSNTRVIKGVATGDLVASLTGTLAAGGALASGLYKLKAAKNADDLKAAAAAAKNLDNDEALSILTNADNIDPEEKGEEDEDEIAENETGSDAAASSADSALKSAKLKKPKLEGPAKTEKRLENLRTGLLFTSGFAGLASALASGFTSNKWRGPEETLNYYETYNRWRDILKAEEEKTDEPKMRLLIKNVLNNCEPYSVEDMQKIMRNMKVANALGYAGAAAGTAGGISSAIAGSKKLKASEKASAQKAVKGADVFANVMAGTTAAIGIASVGFSADMVAKLNKNIKSAAACKKKVNEEMEKNADLMSRIRQTDPRRYLQRGEKEKYPYRNIVNLNGSCTGMLITGNLILTAYHCVTDDASAVDYDFQYGLGSKSVGKVVWHRELKDEDAALVRINDVHKKKYPDYYSGPFPEIAQTTSHQDFNLVSAGYGGMRVVLNSEFETVKDIIASVMAKNPDYYKEAYGKFLNGVIGKKLRKYDAIPSPLQFAMDEEAVARGIKPIFSDEANLKVQENCSILSKSSPTLMDSHAGSAVKNGSGAKISDLSIVYDVKTDCMIVPGNSGGPLLYKKGAGKYVLTGIVSSASGYKYGNNVGSSGGMYVRPEAYYNAISQHDK
jgi:V8-like Glu-specific endopeptidase